MSSSASTYISTPVNVPMADAWGYLNLNTAASPAITDHANVSAISRLGTGRYGITFAASNRFSSNAYVVITTPEYTTDSGYAPVSCRIGNISGSTALGRSAGFEINTFAYSQGFHSGGGTANVADVASGALRVGFAAFSFSNDNRAYSVTGTTYATVPGAAGYGVTGATYNSHLANMVSKRSATAYGTIVIPQAQGNSTPVSAYIENSYNVLGVSAGGNAVFDVSFLKPLNNTNYCVILSGEYESEQGSVVTTVPSTNEFSDLLVRAGASNRFKTVNGFRVESRKQVAADNSWALQSVAYQGGRTERIHFMVFGGGIYGQP
jgi:hypothetical protein